MKKVMNLILVIVFASLYGCNNNSSNVTFNFDFETGRLNDWNVEGKAFEPIGVTNETIDSSNKSFNQNGEYFFYGGKIKLGSIGTMTSNSFILPGNGRIGFLIGAGKNSDLCYVALIDDKGNEIVRRSNLEFDETYSANTLHRVVIDATSYINKKVKIKIVDNDNGTDGYNYLNIDDFILNYQGNAEPVGRAKLAHQYVLDNLDSINNRYRHTYHAMSPLGWSNDPNGMIWYKDKGHLFFQYNPYNNSWGPMHWGHYTTSDFIKWELQPVALAPDKNYDYEYGAFSGTAIEKDGNLYVMYTGVADGVQQQALAVSSDGIVFVKDKRNPVISALRVPSGVLAKDFRDPKVFYKDGYYYCLLGTRMNGYGQLLLYRSGNLTSWQYVGHVLNNSNKNEPNFLELDGVYECPDFITLDGKEVLITSPQSLPQKDYSFENVHSNVYMIGNMNYENGRFVYDEFKEFDGGFDFYAAQTMKLPDGRTILIAWMQMWDRTLVTKNDNWVGAYTLPRELSVKNNRVYQTPIKEVENYRQNKVSYTNQTINNSLSLPSVNGDKIELNLELDVESASKVGIKLFKGESNETLIYYDAVNQTVVLDRSKSGEIITGKERNSATRSEKVILDNNKLKLRIFLDVSSVEVFINDGYITMTANVYPTEDAKKVEFYTTNGSAKILSLDKYDIVV